MGGGGAKRRVGVSPNTSPPPSLITKGLSRKANLDSPECSHAGLVPDIRSKPQPTRFLYLKRCSTQRVTPHTQTSQFRTKIYALQIFQPKLGSNNEAASTKCRAVFLEKIYSHRTRTHIRSMGMGNGMVWVTLCHCSLDCTNIHPD